MDWRSRPLPQALLALALAGAAPPAAAQATFSVRLLTPETALKAAQAALKKCRDSGYQVTVAVVERMGVTQVLLRDRFAGPHTIDMATAKAWSAVSFRTNTSELAAATQPGQPQSGIRHRPGVAPGGHEEEKDQSRGEASLPHARTALFVREGGEAAEGDRLGAAADRRAHHRPAVAAVGGGMKIEASGSLLGAIGVSGAPGGREDDACAAAGIAAIREDIEL